MGLWLVLVRVLTLASLVLVIGAAPAGAQNIWQPTRYDDPAPDGCPPSDCSLREAVIAANGTAGDDIIFLLPGVYSLTRPRVLPDPPAPQCDTSASGGDLDIPSGPEVEVVGYGPQETAIESGDSITNPENPVPAVDRIFDVASGATLSLAALTVMHGGATCGFVNHGHGGAIHNHGSVALDSVTISASRAAAGWGGGGLTNASGATATLKNVTVVNNSADGRGGGMENGGTATLNNVTVGWNEAAAQAPLAGAGLSSTGQATLMNTIVADNFSADDCYASPAGAIASNGYNLSGDASCPFTATGDMKPAPGGTIDPTFASVYDLYFNVRLLELQLGSPAIDAGSPSGFEPSDARGLARPQDGDGDGAAVSDMGAYERATPPGEKVLWEQFDNAGDGLVSSQNQETAYDDFDSIAADDFRIGKGRGWRIDSVMVAGSYGGTTGPADSVNVRFYDDSATLPGSVVSGLPGLVPWAGRFLGNFVLELGLGVELGPGSYWVAVQANQDSTAGYWFWHSRTVQTRDPAVWKNPGGGWGIGCTSFAPRAATCGIAPAEPDQAFRLRGTESRTTLSLNKTTTAIQASGSVTPNHAGTKMKVTLSQDTGGGFALVGTEKPTLDSSSDYATAFARPGGGGVCKVKASFPGDGDHPPSSLAKTINC